MNENVRIGNRRIFTSLAGGHHAFELLGMLRNSTRHISCWSEQLSTDRIIKSIQQLERSRIRIFRVNDSSKESSQKAILFRLCMVLQSLN